MGRASRNKRDRTSEHVKPDSSFAPRTVVASALARSVRRKTIYTHRRKALEVATQGGPAVELLEKSPDKVAAYFALQSILIEFNVKQTLGQVAMRPPIGVTAESIANAESFGRENGLEGSCDPALIAVTYCEEQFTRDFGDSAQDFEKLFPGGVAAMGRILQTHEFRIQKPKLVADAQSILDSRETGKALLAGNGTAPPHDDFESQLVFLLQCRGLGTFKVAVMHHLRKYLDDPNFARLPNPRWMEQVALLGADASIVFDSKKMRQSIEIRSHHLGPSARDMIKAGSVKALVTERTVRAETWSVLDTDVRSGLRKTADSDNFADVCPASVNGSRSDAEVTTPIRLLSGWFFAAALLLRDNPELIAELRSDAQRVGVASPEERFGRDWGEILLKDRSVWGLT